MWGVGGRRTVTEPCCKAAPAPSMGHPSHTRRGKPGHPAAAGSPSRIFISRPPPGPDPVSKSCSTELGEAEGTIPTYNPRPGEKSSRKGAEKNTEIKPFWQQQRAVTHPVGSLHYCMGCREVAMNHVCIPKTLGSLPWGRQL